jgi:hypothetical protein
VAANKVAPGVIDHYVARTAVGAQQLDLAADPDAPADLWAPVDHAEDHGARGRFDDLEGGMRNPRWLASVPRLVLDVTAAAVDRARAVARG